MRLTNKRTWNSSMRSTPVSSYKTTGSYSSFVPHQCTQTVTIRDIGDSPTSIIKDGEIKTVLDCCELKTTTTDRDSLVSAGRALLLDIRSSDAVLVSKIVTRGSAYFEA
jgi:hypothetical protein